VATGPIGEVNHSESARELKRNNQRTLWLCHADARQVFYEAGSCQESDTGRLVHPSIRVSTIAGVRLFTVVSFNGATMLILRHEVFTLHDLPQAYRHLNLFRPSLYP